MSFVFLIGGIASTLRSGVALHEVSFENLQGLPGGLARLEGSALIHAGILVLLVTPVARVAAMFAEALARRERLFAMLSFGILLLLAASLVLSLR